MFLLYQNTTITGSLEIEDNYVYDLTHTARLVGDSVFPREGHVMAYRNGQWGILCRDSWNERDAAVICRQLGYHVGGMASDSTALVDAGPTWVTDFACTGLENNINDCHSREWDRQNCNHSEYSGVSCSTGDVEIYLIA